MLCVFVCVWVCVCVCVCVCGFFSFCFLQGPRYRSLFSVEAPAVHGDFCKSINQSQRKVPVSVIIVVYEELLSYFGPRGDSLIRKVGMLVGKFQLNHQLPKRYQSGWGLSWVLPLKGTNQKHNSFSEFNSCSNRDKSTEHFPLSVVLKKI